MKLQAVVIAFCRLLGVLFIYSACVSLLQGFRWAGVASIFQNWGFALHFLPSLGLLAAAFYVIRHAEPIAFRLVGDVGDEEARFPQERDFWVSLAYNLLAFYLLAEGVAGLVKAVAGCLVYHLSGDQSSQHMAIFQGVDGLGVGVGTLLIARILLARARSLKRKL